MEAPGRSRHGSVELEKQRALRPEAVAAGSCSFGVLGRSTHLPCLLKTRARQCQVGAEGCPGITHLCMSSEHWEREGERERLIDLWALTIAERQKDDHKSVSKQSGGE